MNIYKKIDEWLKNKYEPIGGWLYFNCTPMITGTTAMNSVPGDTVVRKFIDGTKEKQLIFAIDMICNYDNQGTSDINMLAMDEVNNFIAWLQNISTEDYPDLGENNTIKKIEVLTKIPSLLVNTDELLGKYQFQASILYNDESEVIK